MVKFTVEETVTKGINKLIKSLDFKEPLKDTLELLDKEAQQNFDQQGRLYDPRGSWKPLAKSTVRQRVALGYNGKRPILVRSGKLKKSFKGQVKSGKEAIFKNTSKIAKYQQPSRPIVGVTDKMKGAINRLFVNYLAKKIKENSRH